MGKYDTIKGYVKSAHDKLPQILSDLVRLDGVWQQWDFEKFTDSLRHLFLVIPASKVIGNTIHNCVCQQSIVGQLQLPRVE